MQPPPVIIQLLQLLQIAAFPSYYGSYYTLQPPPVITQLLQLLHIAASPFITQLLRLLRIDASLSYCIFITVITHCSLS
jgi:hypothetical protein